MLSGELVHLRPISADDLDWLHARILDIDSRGPWYPLPQLSFVGFRRAFEEHGFWTPALGIFLIVADDDRVVGYVDWEQLGGDIPDMQLGYRTFETADRGKGYATDAVRTLVRWLFQTQAINRVRLVVHVDNAASNRVAEKSGFVREATARGGWPSRGRWHDVNVYVETRAEFERNSSSP